MTLGEKIQKLRKQRGLSQEALAEKVTVTRQTISKWELGQSLPDLDFIAQLSDIFSVSSDYLIKDEMDMDFESIGTNLLGKTLISLSNKISRVQQNQIVDTIAERIAREVLALN